ELLAKAGLADVSLRSADEARAAIVDRGAGLDRGRNEINTRPAKEKAGLVVDTGNGDALAGTGAVQVEALEAPPVRPLQRVAIMLAESRGERSQHVVRIHPRAAPERV